MLGAIWSPDNKKREIAQRINEIKKRHGLSRSFEIKWTKVSKSKSQFYLDIVDYFFDDSDLRFRCLVIPNKSLVDHTKHKQSHDDWYYKMYFTMLKVVFQPEDSYHIYLDIKDTRSNEKVCKLHDVLCNNAYDFSRKMIQRVQQVRSHEVAQGQIADLLIGAMSYKFRNEKGSEAKLQLIDRIAQRSGYSLEKNTLYKEEKFNILVWRGSDD